MESAILPCEVLSVAMKECVFCGAIGEWTSDHVPPRNLFDPAPPNLLTVPACPMCNSGASKDDEYFRMSFVAREDLETHPSIQKPKQAFLRSLQRPQGRGFAKGLASALQDVERVTPAGVYVDTKKGIDIDIERIRRTVQKTVKGLFAHEFGIRLPDTHHVKVLSYGEASDPDTGAVKETYKQFTDGLSREPRRSIGPQFSFFRVQLGSGAESLWLLVFYERVIFFAWTVPKAGLSPEVTEEQESSSIDNPDV